uniref:Uncharacterized protein n=1 Tax=Rhizophora mucronata TaxID=61149 RepID=A0A2P2N5Y3_RHIMU
MPQSAKTNITLTNVELLLPRTRQSWFTYYTKESRKKSHITNDLH